MMGWKFARYVCTFSHQNSADCKQNAYETLYSLMEIAPTRIDIVKLYDRVVAGVGDDRGIQALCNLMLGKLVIVAPDETSQRLDSIAEQFRVVLSFTPKETAVRPEIEKADEAKKGVIKVSLELEKAMPSGVGQGGVLDAGRQNWVQYLGYMREKFSAMVKDIERKL